jgi:hypothetical protein
MEHLMPSTFSEHGGHARKQLLACCATPRTKKYATEGIAGLDISPFALFSALFDGQSNFEDDGIKYGGITLTNKNPSFPEYLHEN